MLNYVLSRLLTFVPTFVGVTLISFAFIRVLPGDPIIVMAGERGLTEERYAELSEQFGFDRPIIAQFWEYFTGGAARGSWNVFCDQATGLGRILLAVSRDAGAFDLRNDLCLGPWTASRGDRGCEPGQVL